MAVVPLMERAPPVDDLSRLGRSHRWCDQGRHRRVAPRLGRDPGHRRAAAYAHRSGPRAEPHVENMQPGEAIRCLDGALARVDRLAERWSEAELYRLKGDALLAVSPKH
jgi:hypothetical protein